MDTASLTLKLFPGIFCRKGASRALSCVHASAAAAPYLQQRAGPGGDWGDGGGRGQSTSLCMLFCGCGCLVYVICLPACPTPDMLRCAALLPSCRALTCRSRRRQRWGRRWGSCRWMSRQCTQRPRGRPARAPPPGAQRAQHGLYLQFVSLTLAGRTPEHP